MNRKIVTQQIFIIILTACTHATITAPSSTSTPTETLVPTPTRTSTSLPPTATPTETLTPTPNGPLSEIIQQGAKMVLIPAGEFQMGSENGYNDEKPVHTVNLDNYYIDVYEVTNALYEKCVQAGVCSAPGNPNSFSRESYYRNSTYADYPVINVNWEQANNFCTWRGARLPTEAEWEKAARGGLKGMDFPWGNEAPVCRKGAENGAKFDDDGDCNDADTEAVGSYAPNGYGLYDMAGNIWEWLADWYGGYSSSGERNPIGPVSGGVRVLRGGAWYGDPDSLRVTARFHLNPDDQLNNVGFRCARSQ